MEKDFYKIADRNNNLGTETAFTVLAKANKLASEGKDIINLGIGTFMQGSKYCRPWSSLAQV